jgi:hypothetical protein
VRITHGRRGRRPAVLALAVALVVGVTAAPARADDPLYVGLTGALPAFAWKHVPSSSDECASGRVSCVERSIRQMERRFEPLAESCSHQAVFALAYLRTTENYLRSTTTPGFYRDPRFVNHEEAAFAELYFAAYDDWAAGRLDRVPSSWRIAFDAAERGRVSGLGNLLLGMNAHVNRDLPFVLAEIGLVAPDGTSRKLDHDRVNVMLNQVVEPLIAEEAARFDPSIRTLPPTPYGVGYTGLMQMLLAWREVAWRHAELLAAAPDDAARARVAAQIELYAATNATALVATTRYLAPVTTSAKRDQHCAAQAGAEAR